MHPMARAASAASGRPFSAGLLVGVLGLALALTGCGTGGTVTGSLPGTLPGTLPGSLPVSRPPNPPTTTETPPPVTSQPPPTSSEPPPTSSEPPPTTTQPPPTTTQPPPTTTAPPPTSPTTSSAAGSTQTATTAEASQDDTPWGWILLLAALLLGAVAVAALALYRRSAARRVWREAVLQAEADGAALHDEALNELVAAAAANRPERWASLADSSLALSSILDRVEAAAPDDDEARRARDSAAAMRSVDAAIETARAAAPGVPLDQVASAVLRERLDVMIGALRELRTAAESR